MKFSSFTHFCRESKSVAIYALYPESFCVKYLAIRKVFTFSDFGLIDLHLIFDIWSILIRTLQFRAFF